MRQFSASAFNVLVDDSESGELLVFNTASGALVAFGGQSATVMRRALETEGPVDLDSLEPALKDSLLASRLVVPVDEAEVDTVLRRISRGISDENRLDVFVLPNLKCNFACPYCFEEHRPSQMSDETARRLLLWFGEMAPRFKVVLLSWFGGEPLLSFDRLLEVQVAARRICLEAGTQFSGHITTNGYHLSPDRADLLVAAGIKSYQVTLDGVPEVHNASRPLKGGGDSFTRVFQNVCDLATGQPEAHIKLRVNFNSRTLPAVPDLLELFPEEVRCRLNLVLERIFGQGDLFEGTTPVALARRTEETYQVARELGFAVTSAALRPGGLTFCYADRANEFVFNHEGDVFKCTVGNFSTGERLGVLSEEGRVEWEGQGYAEWMNVPAVDDKCRSCTFLPMCLGGCRKTRALTGRSSAHCTLPFAALDERILQRRRAGRPSTVRIASQVVV